MARYNYSITNHTGVSLQANTWQGSTPLLKKPITPADLAGRTGGGLVAFLLGQSLIPLIVTVNQKSGTVLIQAFAEDHFTPELIAEGVAIDIHDSTAEDILVNLALIQATVIPDVDPGGFEGLLTGALVDPSSRVIGFDPTGEIFDLTTPRTYGAQINRINRYSSLLLNWVTDVNTRQATATAAVAGKLKETDTEEYAVGDLVFTIQFSWVPPTAPVGFELLE